MLSRSRYIFLLAVVLLSAFKAFAQLPMPDHVCIGASKRYWADSTANPGSTYIWSVNGTVVQNNTICLFARTWTDPGTFELTLQLVSAEGCEGELQIGQVIVDPLLPASVSINADQNNVCAGTLVTYTATPVNGGTPAYQWFVNGFQVGTAGDTYAYTPENDDIIYVIMTSDVGCVSGSPAASAEITMIVNDLLPAGVSIAADHTTVCVGTAVTVTATPDNGGTVPAYQWQVNGINVGTNSNTLIYMPVNGDNISVVMTSNETCVTGNPATSNEIELTVNPILTVEVSVVADANPVFTGTPVTYTATPVNGGLAPVFAWFVNGSEIPGETTETYTYMPVDNDEVYATVVSSETCTSSIPATSNTIDMVVLPLLLVEVSIATPVTTVCAGTTVTFTATPVNGGTGPVYSWYVNGTLIPGEITETYSYIPQDGDVVFVMLLSDAANITGNPATSGTVVMSVTPLITPVFDAIGPLCQNTAAPVLPVLSPEGITGEWSPAVISTTVAGTFTYTFTPDNLAQCATVITMDITIDPEITPAFDAIGPLCQNSAPPALLNMSTNGITGAWAPSSISTLTAGTTSYVFTPDAGQCAISTSLQITIDPEITPSFAPIGPLCISTTPPGLPATSSNGITGTWVPDVINTLIVGTTTYVFTPDLGLCAVQATMDITIDDVLPSTFAAIGPLCLNAVPPPLPATSIEGFTGTWNPATINTNTIGTTTYTFTPDAGQCAKPTTLDVAVITEITPSFDAIGPLCINSEPPALPAASNEGITGTWLPAAISTLDEGTITYTFTPDAGQCAIGATLDITVITAITPVFAPIGPICQNSAPPELPVASYNSINGTWVPATINTGTAGTFTYTFTPDAGECAVVTTIDITIDEEVTPAFDAIGPLCLNSTPPELLTTSLNNISGTWLPATINTGAVGTTSYSFTPGAGQCAVMVSVEIEVTDEIVPVFEPIGQLCLNSAPPVLPGTSENGISGTWMPAIVNTALLGTTTYTFTPFAGQCAVVVTIGIEVSTEILPLFASIGPLCLNSSAASLPATSTNGITGTWVPETINTGSVGITTYTFTPDAGQCAVTTSIDIEVATEIAPLFEPIGPLCLNSAAPPLPATSTNGITGTWVPAVINTSAGGTTIYTFTPADGQCGMVVTMAIQVIFPTTPTFAVIGPLCQNSVPPLLPATSNNGITGNWSPAEINTLVTGTTTYTFTPDFGQCASTATLDIVIDIEITPTFTPIGPLCENSTPPVLPATSTNGIAGTWVPSTINTGLVGTNDYTFTPDEGQCATVVIVPIEVTNGILPEFESIGPLCLNSAAPLLPATSINGITGTWVPAVINTGSVGITTYTFTPGESQCAVSTTMDIEVSDEIVPVFASIGPLCLNSTPPLLPATSTNGIAGTWVPSAINTGSVGTFTYTFTPDAGQCAVNAAMEIVISNGIVPAFTSIGPLCLNTAAPVLPATSLNGITGTWMPQTISTGMVGFTTYTFTPASGQCAVAVVMTIEVTNGIVPVFTAIGPLCPNSAAPALPATSANGITGTWLPSTINTGTLGTTTYTFTPGAGQCAVVTTLAITISGPEITDIETFTSTNGLPNGHARVIAEGDATPLSYSLNGADWQNSHVFTNLPAGTYTAWVKDDNGCTISQQFVILNTITGDVGVLAGNVQSCIGIPFEIPVMAYDFTNISAFTIQLTFDSTVLTFNGLTQVNDLLNGALSSSFVSPGVLQISFVAADSITLLSEDLLLMLNFTGLSSGYTELEWNWLKCIIYSVNGYEIPAIYTKGAVEVRPAPQVYTEGSGAYCEGTPLVLNSGSLTGQNLTYSWISPTGATHTGPKWDLGLLTGKSSGEYRVIASDSTACARTEKLQVKVNLNPDVKLSEYDTLCSEQVVMLNPGLGFVDYSWHDGSKEPQLETSAEGVYWVVVTDTNGCKGSDTVLLIPCDINRSYELQIWLPNAFSPNGDGTNDEFVARYESEVKITFQMMVFNKWGEMLFSSNDITKGWDGKFKGERCPPGLYTWVLTFEAPAPYYFRQDSPMRGNVMILK